MFSKNTANTGLMKAFISFSCIWAFSSPEKEGPWVATYRELSLNKDISPSLGALLKKPMNQFFQFFSRMWNFSFLLLSNEFMGAVGGISESCFILFCFKWSHGPWLNFHNLSQLGSYTRRESLLLMEKHHNLCNLETDNLGLRNFALPMLVLWKSPSWTG